MDEVKQVFVRNIRKNTDECLSMVDSIQRLGMEYNFEEEIEATLERKHTMLRFQNFQRNEYQGLSQAAFQFRMLRQEGYYISPGLFCDNFFCKCDFYCGTNSITYIKKRNQLLHILTYMNMTMFFAASYRHI